MRACMLSLPIPLSDPFPALLLRYSGPLLLLAMLQMMNFLALSAELLVVVKKNEFKQQREAKTAAAAVAGGGVAAGGGAARPTASVKARGKGKAKVS